MYASISRRIWCSVSLCAVSYCEQAQNRVLRVNFADLLPGPQSTKLNGIPHMPLYVSEKLGPYEILAPIGAGGVGGVYRAKGPDPGREPDELEPVLEDRARKLKESRCYSRLAMWSRYLGLTGRCGSSSIYARKRP